MLSCEDQGIGNVTKALEAKGILDDTIVIISSDNGGPSETCGVQVRDCLAPFAFFFLFAQDC